MVGHLHSPSALDEEPRQEFKSSALTARPGILSPPRLASPRRRDDLAENRVDPGVIGRCR
jgi:hypothetical protein